MPIIGVIASSGDRNVPNAPTIGTATNVPSGRAYNNGRADVTFTAPVYTGGTPITGYTVTSSPGGFTGTGASSPVSVTGLQSGVAYTFTVTATNAVGTSAPSAASNSITATTVPQAPTVTVADVGTARAFNNGAATVTITGGATGGSAITSYAATSSPGSFTASGASPLTVTGLASNTAYTFNVTATNANGTSTATTSASITATTVPQAPTIGTATGGDASASVTFTAGATGGKAISTFTATSSPGSITGASASSPITVSGLTNGTAYTFTVTATNANGTSTASAASNSVTPATPFAYNSISSYLTPTTPTAWGTLTTGGSFNSIPQTYRHLQFRISAQSNTATIPDQWYFYINNDFSNRFSEQAIRGQGGNPTVTADNINRTNKIEVFPVGNTDTAYRDTHVFTYFNYTDSSKIKTIRYEYFSYNGGGSSTWIQARETAWINTSTAAITSFQFGSLNGDPVSGCTFALYGIS